MIEEERPDAEDRPDRPLTGFQIAGGPDSSLSGCRKAQDVFLWSFVQLHPAACAIRIAKPYGPPGF